MTFLYELREGACPKSYGTACARLAGMPEPILAKAEHLAAQLESACITGAGSNTEKQSIGTQLSNMPTGLMKELSKCLSVGSSSSGSSDQLAILRELQTQARRVVA